jgi:hypothetical protein
MGVGSLGAGDEQSPDTATTGRGEHLEAGQREAAALLFHLSSCTDPNLARSGKLRDFPEKGSPT